MPRFIVLTVFALGCAPATPPPAAPVAKSSACTEIPGASAILTPGARILIGEMHGNRETPHFVGELACQAKTRGAVSVGLEIPTSEQPAIDRFLASAGTAADRAALVRSEHWTRAQQDGRSSHAMVDLLDRLRVLGIPVVAFDVMIAGSTDPSDRDLGMATNIEAIDPARIVIVLSGNVHNRKTGFRKLITMGQRLVERKVQVLSLTADYGTGSSWMMRGSDGNAPDLGGPGALYRPASRGTPPAPLTITLKASGDGAYDGTFYIPAPTFSPPFAVPLTERQQLRGELVVDEAAAREAYDGKHYARCAELYAALAKRDPVRRSEHAYNSASCFALAGDPEQAFAQLADAVAHGLTNAKHMSEDTDLASLRGDARWSPLIQQVGDRDRTATR